jgi:hypothetical protein
MMVKVFYNAGETGGNEGMWRIPLRRKEAVESLPFCAVEGSSRGRRGFGQELEVGGKLKRLGGPRGNDEGVSEFAGCK